VALVGLSGTGKGTTMSKLKELIPNSLTWSNGNIFRSLTLLATTHCVQQGMDFSEEVLTPGNIRRWINMLKFGRINDKYDIEIDGLGLKLMVSDVQNTVLKGPMVKRYIPTVAKYSQGEVISFAGAALQSMEAQGSVVLLEGREQTVNYIATPHRFQLILPDATLIGQRRAAQRIASATVKAMKDRAVVFCVDGTTVEYIMKGLDRLVREMDAAIAAAQKKSAAAQAQGNGDAAAPAAEQNGSK